MTWVRRRRSRRAVTRHVHDDSYKSRNFEMFLNVDCVVGSCKTLTWQLCNNAHKLPNPNALQTHLVYNIAHAILVWCVSAAVLVTKHFVANIPYILAPPNQLLDSSNITYNIAQTIQLWCLSMAVFIKKQFLADSISFLVLLAEFKHGPFCCVRVVFQKTD